MGHLKANEETKKGRTITPISEPRCQHRNSISSAPNQALNCFSPLRVKLMTLAGSARTLSWNTFETNAYHMVMLDGPEWPAT